MPKNPQLTFHDINKKWPKPERALRLKDFLSRVTQEIPTPQRFCAASPYLPEMFDWEALLRDPEGDTVPYIDCTYCRFRNIVPSRMKGKVKPWTELTSQRCSNCHRTLKCFSCKSDLEESYLSEIGESTLMCSDTDCPVYFFF